MPLRLYRKILSYIPSVDEIKKFRIKLGIEQKELAQVIGVSINMISQIETGRANPNADNYKKIIDYFFQKSDKSEITLEQIWATPVTFLTPRQSAQKVKEYFENTLDIDVLPVLNNEQDMLLLGKISRVNFKKFLETNPDLHDVSIHDILEEAPPTFPYDTPKTWIRQFFK